MDLARLLIEEIPEDGLHLEGELPSVVFDINPEDAVPETPLAYRLDIFRSGDGVLATGVIGARFTRECVRCLEKFSQAVELENYAADLEIENDGTIHLTERLREDILLSLPAYPHCDTSSDGRKCPAADRFLDNADAESAESEGSERGAPPGAWDVLQDWKPAPPND